MAGEIFSIRGRASGIEYDSVWLDDIDSAKGLLEVYEGVRKVNYWARREFLEIVVDTALTGIELSVLDD